jgi:predicted CXXCH cytochrome family protein
VAGPFLALGLMVPAWTSRAAGPYAFPHRPHLRPETVRAALETPPGEPEDGAKKGGTVDAECLVCHDFKKGDEAHFEGCNECHISDRNLTVAKTGAAPADRRAFPHREHLEDKSLTCFACHRPLVENDWVEFSVPPPGLGTPATAAGTPADGPACAACHAAHDPSGKEVPQFAKTGDGRGCRECHFGAASILPFAYRPGAAPAGRAVSRPFTHEDHGGAASKCEECHQEVRTKAILGDYDAAKSTAKACASCHVADARGTPLAGVSDPPRTSKPAYRAVEGFSHPAHMEGKGKIRVAVKVAGCETCHYPEADPAAPAALKALQKGKEPADRAALVSYGACVVCHDDWKVADHGLGRWACFKCHTAKEDRPGHLPMAMAVLERPSVEGLKPVVHPHPGITTAGPPLGAAAKDPSGKDCRECHIGRIPGIPSRLAGKGFLHGPHLPAKPTNADCLRCHPAARSAGWSEDLGSFEPKVCLECHTGATEAEIGIARARRTVPQFDHAAHVAPGPTESGFKGYACTECHDARGETGYAVMADAASCVQCHSHDAAKFPEKEKRTGPKLQEGGEAARCLPCHQPPGSAADSPFAGTVPAYRPATRVHLDLAAGKQWHDLGTATGDRTGGCNACHDRDPLKGKPAKYVQRITEARVQTSVHRDDAHKGKWFNDPGLEKKDGSGDPEGKKRTCLTCHREEPRGFIRELTSR